MSSRRRPFSRRPYEAAVGTTDHPVFSRGTILDNGMIREKPASKTSLERSEAVPDPSSANHDLYALNALQMQRDWPLEALSLMIPLESLPDNAPPDVMRRVGIATAGPTSIFNCVEDDVDVDLRIRTLYSRWKRFWSIFRRSEYVFWPIETEEGYFVTAIFHLVKGLVEDPNVDPADSSVDVPRIPSQRYNVVDRWTIVDPAQGDRVIRVKDRVMRILQAEGFEIEMLSYSGNQTDSGDQWSSPWVPPLRDADEAWSSGIRSFALVRQLLQRIVDFYCQGLGFQYSFFQDPTCGWLNVDQVRHEMMGICAIAALEDMNWNARLAIEVIENINTVDGIEAFSTMLLEPPPSTARRCYVPRSRDAPVNQYVPGFRNTPINQT